MRRIVKFEKRVSTEGVVFRCDACGMVSEPVETKTPNPADTSYLYTPGGSPDPLLGLPAGWLGFGGTGHLCPGCSKNFGEWLSREAKP